MARVIHPTFPSQLKSKTRILLLERLKLKKYTFIFMAKETGLSEQWIGMLSRDEIKSPDVGRVETLYVYLTGKPLEL